MSKTTLTPERLFDYANKYARESEVLGNGTEYPTVRQACQKFRVRQSEIVDLVESYSGEHYFALGVGVMIQGVGVAEHSRLGENVLEAYE